MEPTFVIAASAPFIIAAVVVIGSRIILWIKRWCWMPTPARMQVVQTTSAHAWCAGCDEIVHSYWMRFTDEGCYRCDLCRGQRYRLPRTGEEVEAVNGNPKWTHLLDGMRL